MVDYLDAETSNADWIKQTSPGAWDVDMPTPDEFRNMPLEVLEHLMTLPVWNRAPEEIKAIADERLAEVAD